MTASARAIQAAAWVLDLPVRAERDKLYNGHKIRRRPKYADGQIADDHSEADAWLIEQWEHATKKDAT